MKNMNNLNTSIERNKDAVENIFMDYMVAHTNYEMDNGEDDLYEMLHQVEKMQYFCQHLMNLAEKAKAEIEEKLGE